MTLWTYEGNHLVYNNMPLENPQEIVDFYRETRGLSDNPINILEENINIEVLNDYKDGSTIRVDFN